MRAGLDHPDDLTARIDLRANYRAAREELTFSTEATARLAGFQDSGAVRMAESRMNWGAGKAQRWARALRHTLRLHLEGLTVPGDDARSRALRALNPAGPVAEDRLHLDLLAADLFRTRRALGVGLGELAARSRAPEDSLLVLESDPSLAGLRTYQQYARGLGGLIRPELVPIHAAVRS